MHAGHDGVDAVEFGFTPHSGSDVLPLAKSASGGELSRVMLALEVVLAASAEGTTMVFDEVDAGVGGRAAVQIGRRLARLATHPPGDRGDAPASGRCLRRRSPRRRQRIGQGEVQRSPSPRRTTTGSPSSRGCSPGWANPTAAARTPGSCSRPRAPTRRHETSLNVCCRCDKRQLLRQELRRASTST